MLELNKLSMKSFLVIFVIAISTVVLIVLVFVVIRKLRRRNLVLSRDPRKQITTSILSEPSQSEQACTNDGFYALYESTSARKIEERRQARQMALQHSPRADLTLRKIDPEIGKALAVEQLMRDSLVFDTLPRPPKGDVEIVAAKRDYL